MPQNAIVRAARRPASIAGSAGCYAFAGVSAQFARLLDADQSRDFVEDSEPGPLLSAWIRDAAEQRRVHVLDRPLADRHSSYLGRAAQMTATDSNRSTRSATDLKVLEAQPTYVRLRDPDVRQISPLDRLRPLSHALAVSYEDGPVPDKDQRRVHAHSGEEDTASSDHHPIDLAKGSRVRPERDERAHCDDRGESDRRPTHHRTLQRKGQAIDGPPSDARIELECANGVTISLARLLVRHLQTLSPRAGVEPP